MITALLYGLYAAGVSIAITLIEYFTGMDRTGAANWMSWISLPFLALFIWLAMKERKQEDYGGTISYGQCIGTGVLVGLFSGIVIAIFMYVYLTAINPGFMDYIFEKQANAMRQSGNPNAEKSLEYMKQFGLPITIASSAVGGVLLATIISLIVGIFVRTKPEDSVVKAV